MNCYHVCQSQRKWLRSCVISPNTVKKMKQFLGEELKTHFEGFRDKISTETFDDGKDCLKYGTDNIRSENCLDQVNRKNIFEVNARSFEKSSYLPQFAKPCAHS